MANILSSELLSWNYETDEKWLEYAISSDDHAEVILLEHLNQVALLHSSHIRLFDLQTFGYITGLNYRSGSPFLHVFSDNENPKLQALSENHATEFSWFQKEGQWRLNHFDKLAQGANSINLTSDAILNFNPTTNQLAFVEDNYLHLWHLGEALDYQGSSQLAGIAGETTTVATSTDGNYIATATARNIHLWKIESIDPLAD